MAGKWQEAFTKLTVFINSHPEIKIGDNYIRLPDSVRVNFYKLFDQVRIDYVEQNFYEVLIHANILSQNYVKKENVLLADLGLETIEAEPRVQGYLHAPIAQLTIKLYDPLFKLLKNKIEINEFILIANEEILMNNQVFYEQGYQKWVSLSLLNQMKPDAIYQVPMEELNPKDRHIGMNGPLVRQSPLPLKSNRILFDYEPDPVFTVPDFIAHSATNDGFIAMRSSLRQALGTATNVSQKRFWKEISPLVFEKDNVILLYYADNPNDISLVADKYQICSPDVILCFASLDKDSDTQPNGFFERLETIFPSSEIFLVVYPNTTSPVRNMSRKTHVLDIGFDDSKLLPIFNLFPKIAVEQLD